MASACYLIWKVDLLSSYSDISDNEKIILEYIIKNGSITKNDVLENSFNDRDINLENLKSLQNKKVY